jgi:hypothetical protein
MSEHKCECFIGTVCFIDSNNLFYWVCSECGSRVYPEELEVIYKTSDQICRDNLPECEVMH